MWKLLALLLSLAFVAEGAGAFGSLWLLDFRWVMDTIWPGQELFMIDDADYGRNRFALVSSHPSQYWFRLDAVYVDEPDAISDVSDIYGAALRGQRTLKFIGFFSFLLIMAKLMPMFRKPDIPWHEAFVQSNDYPGEVGCNVTVRSYIQPLVWWCRVGAELSIQAGKNMFQDFKSIKLPRLLIGNEWNCAAWKPYVQNSGPLFFNYTPPKDMDYRKALSQMAIEEATMAENDPVHDIPKNIKKMIVKAYAWEWEQGRWLTKFERLCLSLSRRGNL